MSRFTDIGKRMAGKGARALLAATAFLAIAQPSLAATYGLVVGIDDYEVENDLHGAVADARDIAGALAAYGVDELKVFLDREASKAAITRALDDFIGRGQNGDLLIFTYSGHGAQGPEVVPGEEPDGLDEFFLLSGFDRNNLDRTGGERILDNEIRAYMKQAEDQGMRVIFVADSCHSGGMRRGAALGFRLAPPVTAPSKPPSQAAVTGAAIPEDILRNTLFLAASLESQPTPEVFIEGEPRGALSFAFARALEGRADLNGDGRIARIELEDYVGATIKSYSEALQSPDFRPRTEGAMRAIVFETKKPAGGIAPPRPPQHAGNDRPGQSVGNGPGPRIPAPDPGGIPSIAIARTPGLPPLQGVTYGGPGAFSYDAGRAQLLTPAGDVAAYNVRPEGLQPIVDKFRLLEYLKHIGLNGTVGLTISPVQPEYVAKEHIALSAKGTGRGELYIFDLPNDGKAQFLGRVAAAPGQIIDLGDFSVEPPYGADHVVALAVPPEIAPRLFELLSRKPAPTATELLVRLPELLKGARVGIQPLYTSES